MSETFFFVNFFPTLSLVSCHKNIFFQDEKKGKSHKRGISEQLIVPSEKLLKSNVYPDHKNEHKIVKKKTLDHKNHLEDLEKSQKNNNHLKVKSSKHHDKHSKKDGLHKVNHKKMKHQKKVFQDRKWFEDRRSKINKSKHLKLKSANTHHGKHLKNNVEHKFAEHKNSDRKSVEHKNIEHKNFDRKNVDHKNFDHKKFDHKTFDRKTLDHKGHKI